ncbi:MAG: diguanylate cyclase domain-containing protein [Candidatus Limnocylindrales bacterium]
MSSEPSDPRDPLLSSALRLAETSDLESRLAGLVRDAVALVPGSVAAVYLSGEDALLRPVAAHPIDVSMLGALDMALPAADGEAPSGAPLRERHDRPSGSAPAPAHPHRATDAAALALLERREIAVPGDAPAPSALLLAVPGARSALCLPLVLQHPHTSPDVEGVFCFTSPSEAPGADARATLRALAAVAAVAVAQARLESAVAERSDWFDRLAQTDSLTGLANRRMLDRVLELELARAARQGTALCVAIFALDGHERMTQVHGAHAADDVLRRVAAALADTVRLVDTVARYDREAFVVVAPGSSGRAMAERAAAAIRQAGLEIGEAAVTLSVGLAAFPANGTSADELLAAAEQALGEARAQGGAIAAAG